MKVEIRSRRRWHQDVADEGGRFGPRSVLFTAEIPYGAPFSTALEMAVREHADLSEADLTDAYLSFANLAGARLHRANLCEAYLTAANLHAAQLNDANLSEARLKECKLSEAVLRSANLSGTDLSYANLAGANLRSVNLSGANLHAADLSNADLTRANLSDADLDSANLTKANLRGANLSAANLVETNLSFADTSDTDFNLVYLHRAQDPTVIRDDFWAVLSAAPKEAEGLRLAIIEGRVDGNKYQGECGCVLGTIANIRRVDYRELHGLEPNAKRPIEHWFRGIKKGDTPENNNCAKWVLVWLDEWLESMRSTFGPARGLK